jgi:hypothetical protein
MSVVRESAANFMERICLARQQTILRLCNPKSSTLETVPTQMDPVYRVPSSSFKTYLFL